MFCRGIVATSYFSDIYHHKREWQDEEIEEAGGKLPRAYFPVSDRKYEQCR
ncbi:MAG: hypothetical protein MET45_06760 [Nostoc sp. LLA-1]|nr:hypothetical protein [Cyanocohniella sp. LLY]